MKIKPGFLSGYGTQAGAIGFAIAAIGAFALDAPFMGEQPMGLGALILALIGAFIAYRQRLGTKKAQKAAEAVVTQNGGFQHVPGPTKWSGGGPANLFLLALLPALMLGGCKTAQIARNEALMPAVRLAAPGVRSDCYRGIADAVSDGDMVQVAADELQIQSAVLWFVIDTSDRRGIAARLPTWKELRPFGDRGIQDMIDDLEIGPVGAASRTERLDLFGEALRELAEGA